jgi:photosystem II stability/assembly factor-like uncharacterized protein
MRNKKEFRGKPRSGSGGARRQKKPKPPGGKALQRLFAFLAKRDPKLNNDIIAAIPVPKSARPNYAFTKEGLQATPATAATVSRRRTPEAKGYAASMVKASAALTRRTSAASGPRRTAPPPGPAGVWQAVGPTRIQNGQTYGTNRVDVIGRVASIAVDPTDPKHLLLGAAGGGIWESRDTGATWAARTDQMPSLAIGAIAFDPTNASRVYAGSGEGNFYSNLGAGVYQSTDGGANWTVSASSPFVGVGFFDLVVDPNAPATLYAGTTNGFYKSTNSGASWSLKRAGMCWDISIHPQGGAVEILAAFADGLFSSTNGGNTLTAVALPSQPSGLWSRLGVDRVTTSPDVAYVFGATETDAFLWRRSGTVWSKVTLPAVNHDSQQYFPNKLEIGQAQYDWVVTAPPDNPGQVFIGAIDTFRGTLSGSTWRWQNVTTHGNNSIHPDQHCLTITPGNSKIIYAGNDGGIYRSADSGDTWKSLNDGLEICEVEYLACDPNTWEGILAGTQDNGSILYTGSKKWKHVGDGDGGDCAINQLNPDVMYHSFYDVSLERSSNKGQSWTDLNPPAFSAFDKPPTCLFYPPVEVSGLTVAIGAKSLVVTRSGAGPWTTVPLGLPTGELPSAMREIDANTLLVGTNRGKMLKVTWNGASWKKTAITSPAARYISCIAVDPSNPQRYWVTVSQVGGGLVFRSDNGGSSWTNRTANLPAIAMNAVVVDPANFQRIWVAADVGVYQTSDHGATWTPFSNGLPNAMAVDLVFHRQDRALLCGTRNRGVWVMLVT